MSLFRWSRTAATNNAIDPTVNWNEGQAPSTINDSARGMMAATAKFRDDIAGATNTAGGPNAYTLTTYQVFDSHANMNGQMVAFTMNVTNAATVTLSVDGLAARPVRSAPGVELPAGVLIAGTPYIATYYNATGQFILSGFYGNPYNVPVAGGLAYFGSAVPNSLFILPYGQELNRSTYADLFNRIGTSYGIGNGTTTFNAPDLRGRLMAFWDSMGGTPSGRLTYGQSGIDGTTLGATGGAQTRALIIENMPAHGHAGSVSIASTGTASGTAAGNATGTASGNATQNGILISGDASGSGALTATTTNVFARGSGTLSASGSASGTGTLTGTGSTGIMNASNPHNHILGVQDIGITAAAVGGYTTVLQMRGAITNGINRDLTTNDTAVSHGHTVDVSVPYNLSLPATASVPYNLAFALDAISVPYSLSLPYSTSINVSAAYATTVTSSFSVPVSSTVSTTGSGSFTTNPVGSASPFSTAQNTIVANFIFRII